MSKEPDGDRFHAMQSTVHTRNSMPSASSTCPIATQSDTANRMCLIPTTTLRVLDQHLCKRPALTPYAGGGVLSWPPPVVLPSTDFAAGMMSLGQPGGGGGADRGGPVLEEVASR